MKQLNFTAKEILPSLLDKSKTQTIRKAWTEINIIDDIDLLHFSFCKDGIKPAFLVNKEHKEIEDKPPKFKVGDEVELVWNRDSEHQYFNKKTGNAIPLEHFEEGMSELLGDNLFSKNLGKVTITEVFEIEMEADRILIHGEVIHDEELSDIAEKDGFKSAENMFAYFDENYDLSSPKKFHVYRWEWL